MAANGTIAGPIRVAELLVPLSLVMDLGMGAPDDHAARACLLATGLGERLGLSGPALADVYYTTLLTHLGCTATADEEASHLGGDELATRPLVSRTDFGRPAEMVSLLASIGRGRAPVARARVVLGMLAGGRWGSEVERAVCEVAALVAARLRMPEAVCEALGQTFERWDGKGHPRGLRGTAIALAARLGHVASRAAALHELAGVDAAVESVRVSRAGWFDPEIADAFREHGRALLAEMDAVDPQEAALEREPSPWRTVDANRVEEMARAFADMADLKSVFTLGHSPGVATLVEAAAPRLGLGREQTTELVLAALLHDLGRVGVPSGTWGKRSRLGSADWERIRLHPYYTERVLARSRVLERIAVIAGMHHERLDGSGYHRGSRGREIPAAARLLAAADTYQAKTQPRPHRPAQLPEQAAVTLADEASAGRLDGDAVAAVVEAAGRRPPRIARSAPAGLTDREHEVLRLLAEGCSNREVAARLVISSRTAEHHVQHIYEKIGLSTRAGAVMWALQRDLLVPPLDS